MSCTDEPHVGGICTFAYPYMNGKLHAGHAMTIVNADVAARWRQQQGADVLFPFGFHCTGMPIYASAEKLKRGDQNVRESLLSMGIPENDLDKFKDPRHWVTIFPALALKDLKRLNLMCDFSRSFVTTDVNPYYDSFVRWQYNHLYVQGKLKYANRPCIYSVLDQQPCADHDRQSGEGVKPVKYQLYLRHSGKFICSRDQEVWQSKAQAQAQAQEDTDIWIKLTVNHCQYVGKILFYLYQCIKYQGHDVEQMTDQPTSTPMPTPTPTHPIIDLWLPESPVISRTGDRCIVACVPQWYLTYSDPEWKESVRHVLDRMTIHDPELGKQLEIALMNMDDWCVSREYGLGTRLPCDPKFLIDSLSDSTIYMAYYTICNRLHKDIYGHEPIIPISEVNDKFWDAIFLGTGNSEYTEPLRKEFLRYYPPCLRVSGKDLIYNHLIMSVYHHVAIFGSDMCCREYLVNGYAKLNGEKMSKSTGNFVTLGDALDRYRTDAFRVMLIESGDGLEDANIRLKDHDAICSALDQLYQTAPRPSSPHKPTAGTGYHRLYHDMILHCHSMAQHAYRVGKFREAITYGWRKCTKVIATYRKHNDAMDWIVQLGHRVCWYTMTPILGLADPVHPVSPAYPIPDSTEKYYELVQLIHNSINKKGPENIKGLTIHQRLETHISDIIEHITAMHHITIPITLDHSELHPNRDPYRLKPVVF